MGSKDKRILELESLLKEAKNAINNKEKIYQEENAKVIRLQKYQSGFRLANLTIKQIEEEIDRFGRVKEESLEDEIENYKRRISEVMGE